MHAMIAMFSMGPATKDAQLDALKNRIVPTVRGAPGFVSGYWSYDHASNMSYSYILLRSEDDAKKLAEFVRGESDRAARDGVHLERVTVAEVLANA